MKISADFTCDIWDAYETKGLDVEVQVIPLERFRHYGGKKRFCGKVQTVQCYRDNSMVKKQVESPGEGRVLIVDGGFDTCYSLLGDNFAKAAIKNGWKGIIVAGAIRDVETISTLDIGVVAVGSCPRRTIKKQQGTIGLDIVIMNQIIRPDGYVYADPNGILFSSEDLLPNFELEISS